MSATPPRAAPPPRRWVRWLRRGTAALLFVALPLVAMAALAAGWVRSYSVHEIVRAYHQPDPLHPRFRPTSAVAGVPRLSWGFMAEADRGLLALSLYRVSDRPLMLLRPLFADSDYGSQDWVRCGAWAGQRVDQGAVLRAFRDDLGSTLVDQLPDRVDPTKVPEGDHLGPSRFVDREGADGRTLIWPGASHRSFDRQGELVGGGSVAHWSYSLDAQNRSDPAVWSDHARILAPFWAWIVPGLVPIVGWCWCPAGRIWPRLTVRRSLLATATLGVYLGSLLQVPDADRAVLTLSRYDAQWLVGPDPAGSGRTVVLAVLLGVGWGEFDRDLSAAQVAPLRSALARLTDLRVLNLAEHILDETDLGQLLPDALPHLETLDLCGSSATDATLAPVAGYSNLRQLFLGGTHVTDAGLAHLRGLTRLEDLGLENLSLTDAGLVHLRGLSNLRRVSFHTVDGVGFGQRLRPGQLPMLPDAALRRLADSLPNLEELVCPDGTVLRPSRPGAANLQPEPQP